MASEADDFNKPERQENLNKVPLFDRLFGALADPALRSRSPSTASESSENEKVNTAQIKEELNDTIFKSISTFTEVKNRFADQKEKLEKEREKLVKNIKNKKDELMKKMNTSKSRRNFDKITFFLSLMIIQYKSYALGRYADDKAYILNFVILVILLSYRHITYRMSGDHYYMLEFCYFGNAIMYAMIFFFPECQHLYLASFAFAAGPIGWALALVRCKFVLHSIDNLTSVFIHFTPMTLMWNLHWKTQYNDNKKWIFYNSRKDTLSWSFIGNYYFCSVSTYLVWCVLYYLIVFVIAKKRIAERNYNTLKTYYESQGGAEGRFLNRFGAKYSGLVYLGSHFTVFLFTATVGILCYFSFYLHCILVVAMSSACFWNGASYYMHYFSRKYEVNLAKLDEVEQKIEEGLQEAKKNA